MVLNKAPMAWKIVFAIQWPVAVLLFLALWIPEYVFTHITTLSTPLLPPAKIYDLLKNDGALDLRHGFSHKAKQRQHVLR
jgi:hypothetical protein